MNQSACYTVTGAAESAPRQRVLASNRPGATAGLLEQVGRFALPCGLVVVLGWIGAMKFTAYEAEAISGFVANSPLLSWVYAVLNHRQFAAVLGVVELSIAGLIALKPFWPRAAAFGAAAASGMFITTLSFMATTPGVFEATAGGFPALSALPGQFLVKDAALLGISLWILADTLTTFQESHGHGATNATCATTTR